MFTLLLLGCLPGKTPPTLQVPPPEISPRSIYTLVDVIEVDGRQGVAVDENAIYISGSKTLSKYTKRGELLLQLATPLENYPVAANHIGDIDVYNGELYLGVEWFVDGQGKDIQITIHDADTLALKRSFPFAPSSGQKEVSGIAVDREHQTVWMASWVGGDSGRHLYEYDLQTGKYLRKVAMDKPPQWIQGIFYHQGALYLTADDGDAEKGEFDNLYRVSLQPETLGMVSLEKQFTEVKRVGEIEGLAFDPSNNLLYVHFNRGKRIIHGMPKGLYPGYDKEIHEVYRYKITPP